MEKIIVCQASDADRVIQPLLDDGYKVKHCVAEHVSTTFSSSSGKIVFILEK